MTQIMGDRARKSVIQLVFPGLPAPFETSTRGALNKIRNISEGVVNPISTFGLELKAQYYYEMNVFGKSAATRKVFYRPSQEPIIFGSLDRLSSLDFDIEGATHLASILSGKKVIARTSDIWADGPFGQRTIFEPIDRSITWLSDLHKIIAMGYDPVTEAVVSYSRIVFAHPFRDGNGRFARAVLYGALSRRGVITSPCLALGSTFDANRVDLALESARLSKSGCWSNYVTAVALLLQTACDTAKAALSTEHFRPSGEL